MTFFIKDYVSHQAPRKRDTIVVRSNGQKKTMQRWHLTMNIGEVYELFKMEYPNAAIGKSKFAIFKLVSTIFLSNFYFFHQMIALQKL